MGHMQITRVQCFEFLSNLWQVVQICHFANSQEKPHKENKCQSTTPTPNIGMFLKKLHLLLRVLKFSFLLKFTLRISLVDMIMCPEASSKTSQHLMAFLYTGR